MAAEETKVVGAFPPPPAYYKLFAAKSTGGISNDDLPHEDPPTASGGFPLEPPPPPGPGATYKVFGMPYSAEPVVEELLAPEKIVVPPPGQPIDYRAELKGLLNSIMANYCQFMDMLVSVPSKASEKLSDVETLFVNMHSLLNRYRAHQARHLILERMRRQAEEHKAVASTLEAAIETCIAEQRAATACLNSSDEMRPATSTTSASNTAPYTSHAHVQEGGQHGVHLKVGVSAMGQGGVLGSEIFEGAQSAAGNGVLMRR